MARPKKQGVDYFPLDVHLDDKFKFIEIKYGLEGFALLIKLFQKIYAYGYWYKWTEDEALIFADETRSTLEMVKNVVNESLERNIFDKHLYHSYNILTSRGIQKRYKEIVRRRKDVEVIEEYLLIDGNFGVNDDINTSTSKQNDSKSTQSKVKESKVKKSKEEEDDAREENIENDALVLFDKYICPISEYIKQKLLDWIEDLGEEVVCEAIRHGAENSAKSYKYINKILLEWHKNNLRSVEDVKNYLNRKNNTIPFKPKRAVNEIDWDNL